MALVNVLSKEADTQLIIALEKLQIVLANLEIITNELAIITRKVRESGTISLDFTERPGRL